MNVLDANQLKQKLKTNQSPLGKKLFSLAKAIRVCDIRYPVALNKLIYTLYICFRDAFNFILRVLFQTPAFRGRCQNAGKSLYLYGGIPFVSGPLSISVGDRCRISGQTTFSASAHTSNPSLIIGSNVGIGWQTTIAVGTRVVIEDNVRIAGKANLFGYSGHPLDARKRAKGEPDDINQIGDIVLKRDCWLGTNCIVKSGVTIGQGAVIASGSVVTEDIPPFVIAAGVPAKVIKYISQETHCEQGGEHA